MDNYRPHVGDRIEVYHPNGLYSDHVTGPVFMETYIILSTNGDDPDRRIKMESTRIEVDYGENIWWTAKPRKRNPDKEIKVLTEVEEQWFDTKLTGRVITKL